MMSNTDDPRQRFVIVAALAGASLAIVFALLTSGCTTGARQANVGKALAALNAARDGFLHWDEAHQRELVAQAVTARDAQIAIDAYYAKRAPVLASIEAAYAALELAAIDDRHLGDALGALLTMYNAIGDLIGGYPWDRKHSQRLQEFSRRWCLFYTTSSTRSRPLTRRPARKYARLRPVCASASTT